MTFKMKIQNFLRIRYAHKYLSNKLKYIYFLDLKNK